MSAAVLQRLAALLPPGRLLERPEQLAAYESDGLTAFRDAPAGGGHSRNGGEVIALVRFATRSGCPLSRAAAARVCRAVRCRWRAASSSR